MGSHPPRSKKLSLTSVTGNCRISLHIFTKDRSVSVFGESSSSKKLFVIFSWSPQVLNDSFEGDFLVKGGRALLSNFPEAARTGILWNVSCKDIVKNLGEKFICLHTFWEKRSTQESYRLAIYASGLHESLSLPILLSKRCKLRAVCPFPPRHQWVRRRHLLVVFQVRPLQQPKWYKVLEFILILDTFVIHFKHC